MKIICCLAFLIVPLWSGMTQATELNWQTLSTPQMQVSQDAAGQGEVLVSPVPFFREIGTYFWEWDPKLELKKTSTSVYLEPKSKLNEVMSHMFMKFDVISDATQFRKTWFQFSPHLKFRGILGVHDFTKKRPLIILRMGIYGNVDELMGERFLARAIYEDLDANILVLESSTSAAFFAKNQVLSFGGVEEGLQSFLVLQELSRSELMKVTSSFHLVGLSLGANGTFLTALLDYSNGKKIKSIVNFCPLINVQKTFEYHLRPGMGNAFADIWSSSRLQGLVQIYASEPVIQGRWRTWLDFKPRFTPAMLSLLNRDRKKPLLTVQDIEGILPKIKWPSGIRRHLDQSADFFELSNFWPYYQGVRTPIMIYSTPHDELVVNELNSEMIFSGLQPGDFSALRYERLDRGIHCGLASAYRWDYVVQLLRNGL